MTSARISDVCIIGGGPAGLAAAISVTQAGYRATIVDHAVPPIDKACGEGLMPDSIAVLGRLGISVPFDVGFRFRGIRFCDNHSSVAADFPNGQAFGVRRLVLHDLLLKRVQELGIACLWGAKQVEVCGTRVRVDGATIRSGLVVAADGQNSSIRRACGLQEVVREQRRYGFRRHYRIAPWSAYMDLHWGPKCQIYVTPVAADEICIASLSTSSNVRLAEALAHFPEIRERLGGAAATSRERGGLSVSRKLHRVYWDGVALVGDASGSVDAITGEGLCLSFKQALALADALQSGNLRNYQAAHAALCRRPRFMGMLMLSMDRHPRFQRRVLAGLATCPSVFSSLLAAHVGEGSAGDFFSWHTLDFCRAFLEA